MINDCHIHLGKQSMINQELTVDELIKWREQNNINKVLVMGSDLQPWNGVIWELAHTYDWIYGLHWHLNEKTLISFDSKIIGMKYHGTYTNKPVTSLEPEILEELEGKILLVHCGRYLEGDIKSNTSYLHALEIARNYPKIKVILGHMGGTDTTVCKKAIHYATMIHNVYFDTSGITTPYIIEHAVEQIPVTRILFGSDMPWCSFNAMVSTVEDAMITRLQKEDILSNNFELLLK